MFAKISMIMLKRLLFAFMTVLVIFSAALVGYKIYEPGTADEMMMSDGMSSALDFETLGEYTRNSGTASIHYYFFCSALSNDCVYVKNTVLKSTAAELDPGVLDLIEYVDVSDADPATFSEKLKSEWELTSYPAFLACHTENGQIIIDNKLEWTAGQPFSNHDVAAWLNLNGLTDSSSLIGRYPE